MYYIYILQSKKDNHFYTGYTSDLRKRIDDHNEGKVTSTKFRRPLQLIYFEGCLSQKDALHREKYLKTSWGKRYINNRIKDYLTGLAEATTTEISKEKKPKTFKQSKIIAKQGGNYEKQKNEIDPNHCMLNHCKCISVSSRHKFYKSKSKN